MKNFKSIILISLFLSNCFILQSQQTAKDYINKGNKYLKAKNYKDASTSLQYAVIELNKLYIKNVANQLPFIIGPYKCDTNQTSLSPSSGMSGGGFTISKTYNFINPPDNQENKIEILIIGNSPIIATIKMAIKNPMFVSNPGEQLFEIQKHTGILKKNEGSFIFQLPVITTLINITGTGIKNETAFKRLLQIINFEDVIKALGE